MLTAVVQHDRLLAIAAIRVCLRHVRLEMTACDGGSVSVIAQRMQGTIPWSEYTPHAACYVCSDAWPTDVTDDIARAIATATRSKR